MDWVKKYRWSKEPNGDFIMALATKVESRRKRLSIAISVRYLLLITLIMTAMLLTMTLLFASVTPTTLHCLIIADDRKRQRSLPINDSVNTTRNISTSGERWFIVNNAHLCDAVVDDDGVTSYPVYVVVVHSRPGQRGRMQRDAIRLTWGSTLHRRVAQPDIRLVFMLGRDRDCADADSACFPAAQRERQLYRDVVVADFVDTYRNLSLKSLSGLLWARQHCRAARYIVKADDDVYMRPELLPGVQRLTSADSVIVGSLNVNSTVQRRGIWRVDEQVFPEHAFPAYCSGNIYAMTSSVADRLLAVAKTDGWSSPFPLEDVYITALLATSVGVKCVHDDGFPQWDVGPRRANVERLRNGTLLAVHNVHYTQMYDIVKVHLGKILDR